MDLMATVGNRHHYPELFLAYWRSNAAPGIGGFLAG
jgi:hypothetical protein